MADGPTEPALTGLLVAPRGLPDTSVAAAIVGRLVRRCAEVYAGPGLQVRGASALTVPEGDTSSLALIVAALERAPTSLVAVVGADLAGADPRVLSELARRWAGEAAVVPVVEGRVRPFHGIYATTAAERLRAVLESGTRSVLHALSSVGASVAGEEAWGSIDETGSFAVPPT